jgi:hypothetical protein
MSEKTEREVLEIMADEIQRGFRHSAIADALTSLKAIQLGRVGDEKEARYIDSAEAIQYNNESFLKTEGFNQCRAEIIKRIEEGCR